MLELGLRSIICGSYGQALGSTLIRFQATAEVLKGDVPSIAVAKKSKEPPRIFEAAVALLSA